MSKSTNFSGQPIFNQLLNFIDKSEVKKIGKSSGAERYVKKFSTYNHLVVLLFTAFEGYSSIRETILANAHKLSHLALTILSDEVLVRSQSKKVQPGIWKDIDVGLP